MMTVSYDKSNFKLFKDIHQLELDKLNNNNNSNKYAWSPCIIFNTSQIYSSIHLFNIFLFLVNLLLFSYFLFVDCFVSFLSLNLSFLLAYKSYHEIRFLIFLLIISCFFFSLGFTLNFSFSTHWKFTCFAIYSRTQSPKWHFNWAYSFMTILCCIFFPLL